MKLGRLQERRLKQMISETRGDIRREFRESTVPSKYIGVRGVPRGDSVQWVVRVGTDLFYMAPTESEVDAAQAYNFMAVEKYGNKTALNVVPQPGLEGLI